MLCNRRFVWGAVLSTLVFVVPVTAADSPLSQVPADTPLVFHVRGFERTRDRLLTMIKNALPDLAAKAQNAIDDAIKQALEGRALKALPKDGSIFLAVFDLAVFDLASAVENNRNDMALFVQVTSYADFRDAALKADERKALRKAPAGYEQTRIKDQDIYFIDRKDYAVVTGNKALAVRLTKKQAGLDGTLPRDLAGKLLEADTAIYFNMAAINKVHGAQIKGFRQEFDKMIAQSAAPDSASKSTSKMMQQIADLFFQAVADSQAIVASYEFRPEGLKLRCDVSVGKDSKTNLLLQDFQSDAFADLSRLPAGEIGYFGVAIGSRLFKDFMPLFEGVVADPNSPEGKAYKEALDALAEARLRRIVESFRLPASGLVIWDCEYPDKAATAHLQLLRNIKAANPYMSGFLKGDPKITTDAHTYRGFKLHSAAMTWDFDKIVDQAVAFPPRTDAQKEQMKSMMKKLMGDRMHYWFGSNGKLFVMLTGDNWEDARKPLDTFVDGKHTIGGVESFRETRRHLPTRATVMGLIDAPLYAEAIFGFMQASVAPGGKLPAPVQGFKAPVGKHSFLGMAASFQEQQASFEEWIPVTAVSQLRGVFEPLFKELK